MDIEKLWEAACSGDMETLKEYYENGEGIIDIRYKKFRTSHSLIMCAFRNSQFETVEYLLSVGESITYKERKEVQNELKRIEILKRLGE